ncbi:unnamed protein product [Peniophora sp. CBMAI 1063]|nr:unnamed protein product [Peniophora sp. CBMAI 1063]
MTSSLVNPNYKEFTLKPYVGGLLVPESQLELLCYSQDIPTDIYEGNVTKVVNDLFVEKKLPLHVCAFDGSLSVADRSIADFQERFKGLKGAYREPQPLYMIIHEVDAAFDKNECDTAYQSVLLHPSDVRGHWNNIFVPELVGLHPQRFQNASDDGVTRMPIAWVGIPWPSFHEQYAPPLLVHEKLEAICRRRWRQAESSGQEPSFVKNIPGFELFFADMSRTDDELRLEGYHEDETE